MTTTQNSVPHLALGQTAPTDIHGATFTLSSGHTASVCYYGKKAHIDAGDAKPLELAILFLREVLPANPTVNNLTIGKTVRTGRGWREDETTTRYTEFYFPWNEYVTLFNGPSNKRYYRADGSSLSTEQYREYAEQRLEERRKAEELAEAEKLRKRDAGRAARLDYVNNMDPREAHAILVRMAQWWDQEDDTWQSVGGMLDTLLTAFTGIKDEDQ